jgi:hypothetical protein
MPISFVGASPVVTGANPAVAVPAGVVAGDTLILVTSSASIPATPTNWTILTSTVATIFSFIKIATASETSVSVILPQADTVAYMIAYRGVGYVDVIGTTNTSTSTSPVTNSLTTRFANDWVLSFYTISQNATPKTFTAPASTTSRVNQTNTSVLRGMLLVDEAQAVAGASATRTATLSGSQGWVSQAIALKEPQDFYIDPINGNDANNGQTFATSLKNISGATAAKGITAGDTVRVEETPTINTGVNATWTSVQQRGVSPFNSISINAATNATPIVISTSLAHGYSTGDVISINSVVGNTAANGVFKVTVVNSTSFSLDDSSGNGARTSGGVIEPIFCRTIKTATPLVQPIASFAPLRTASLGTRAAWVGSANVSASILTTGFTGKGGVADEFSINTSFTTGKIAYYTLPVTLNLSSYQQLSLFIRQFSGTLGGLTISLCSDTLGDTAVDTFTIPSTGFVSTAGWTPFTFDKGSALGSSIRSISISRAINNGSQGFSFNSIVACKAPSSVDALSNTSLVTKNNGIEGAYAVGGFGGSDGSIVFLDNSPQTANLTTTGGAYYGTTETASLWRIEPYNPFTLNSVALPATPTAANTYCTFDTNSGILNNPITYSGGWNTTDMSTRTGQTWFSNQNGNSDGILNSNTTNFITIDRLNYTRCNRAFLGGSSFIGNIIQNCNYTATSGIGINTNSTSQQQVQNCIVTNTNNVGIQLSWGSDNVNNPVVINNCTIGGTTGNNLNINLNTQRPYHTITNNTFNTSNAGGLNSSNLFFGNLTNNSFNYFNSTGLVASQNILGTINNLTFVPEPAGGAEIIFGVLSQGNSVLPQNIYTTFNNVTVNAPTTVRASGTTSFNTCLNGCSNFKFLNCSFGATNVSYGNNVLYEQGGAYLYNCTGIPTTVASLSNTSVPPYFNNAAFYSQDEGNTVGNNKIYFQGGLATSQTAVRNTPSGYAWSMAPTSTTTVTSVYPIKLKIASIAANGGSPVTISAFMRRTNTGLTMQLVCPAGQPYGPIADTVSSMTAAADTWEQVSISFTPTQNAVYDIYAYAFGGTTFTGYVDDLEVTQ